MQRLKAGTRGLYSKKVDRVFCLIYVKNVYIDGEKCSLVLAQMRNDGMLGFPGGKVENYHKTLKGALKDELKQEINFYNVDERKLKPMVTFADDRRHVTAYKYEVDLETFKKIHRNSHNAECFYSENMGSVALKITKKSLQGIKKQKFRGMGKLELDVLIKEEKLIID